MLKVKHLDFEALIKDLPKSNPFILEISNVYETHLQMIDQERKNDVKKSK